VIRGAVYRKVKIRTSTLPEHKTRGREVNGVVNRCLVTKGIMVRNQDSFPIGKEDALEIIKQRIKTSDFYYFICSGKGGKLGGFCSNPG